MRSGDRPGLQNRRVAGNPVTGGFDSHSLPPFAFNNLHLECVGICVRNSDLSRGFAILSTSTRRKLKYQLGLFEQYLAARSKFFPHEMTADESFSN
jgi:hypothetical protein